MLRLQQEQISKLTRSIARLQAPQPFVVTRLCVEDVRNRVTLLWSAMGSMYLLCYQETTPHRVAEPKCGWGGGRLENCFI